MHPHDQRRRPCRRSSRPAARGSTPLTSAIVTEMMPTYSEIRAPLDHPARMSRPNSSVPSQVVGLGGWSSWVGLIASGSYGARYGAKIAAQDDQTRITPPSAADRVAQDERGRQALGRGARVSRQRARRPPEER